MTENSKKLKLSKKTNFHLHLTGSLEPVELRYLSKITNTDISSYEPLESHLIFDDPIIWSAAKELTSNAKGLIEAIKIVLRKEAVDNVKYVELTINPFGMIRRGMSCQEIINSIR